MSSRKRAALAAIGSRPVTAIWRMATGHHLRILCYHDVPSRDAFHAQLEHLVTRYQVVAGEQIEAAVHRGHRLPRRAVWLTFDDGDPSVIATAQPLLDAAGVRATMFICPGVVDTESPFWWQVIEQALAAGEDVLVDGQPWRTADVVTALKRVDDDTRRASVTQATTALEVRGIPVRGRQLSTAQLRTWVARGHEVGNHTWDHPLLDRCTPNEQRLQIGRAYEWLNDHVEKPKPYFAYPNGNATEATAEVLRSLGYRIGLLFDHKPAVTLASALKLSRIALDADAPLQMARARSSGAFAAVRWGRELMSPRP